MFFAVRWVFLLTFFFGGGAAPLGAQDLTTEPAKPAVSEEAERPEQTVEVLSETDDADIARRLSRILTSTGWFERTKVEVREGVVTLDGIADTQEHREWARDLAAKTEGVVAVINRIETKADVRSTFGFARDELTRLT
jgi:hypothetical protein